MKLKTMLLPTGEFALIASECPSTDTDDALRGFGELIGAAAVLITDEEVDVEEVDVEDLGAIRTLPVEFAELTDENTAITGAIQAIEPKVGDTVRIIEVCGGNREPYMKYVGVAGEVAAIDPPMTRLGETCYWVKTAELDGIWATKVEVISDGR